ncbi:MAG: prefoldin subunit alpha [Desulfurococcaceae archaeon]|jgi:prefoldin alpha subunit
MSDTSTREQRRVVSLDELLTRVNELRERIEILDTTLNTYLSHYRELQLAVETIKNLSEKSVEGYVILDRLSSLMIPANISENWYNNILVNLGLGYYVKLNKDKAVEILTKRIQELEKTINSVQAQRRTLTEEYAGLQRVLSQVIESQQARQQSG